MQNEHDQLLGLLALALRAGRDHFAQLETFCSLRDVLEIVRIVVLAVDEDDLFGATRDVHLAAVNDPEVAACAASHLSSGQPRSLRDSRSTRA